MTVALLCATLLVVSPVPAGPGDASPTGSADCILDWGLPVCALHPGQCLQRSERACFLPAAWAKISTRYREMAAELEDWPDHCERLRASDRKLCDDLVDAADAECAEKVETAMEATRQASKPPLWPRIAGGVGALLATAGAVWCALDEQPGDWPCWAAGGLGLGTAGVVLFGW